MPSSDDHKNCDTNASSKHFQVKTLLLPSHEPILKLILKFFQKVCEIINVSASLELVCEDNSCKEKHKGVIVLQMLTLELFLRAKDPLQENLFIYLLQVPAQQQIYQHLHRKQKHSYLMFI